MLPEVRRAVRLYLDRLDESDNVVVDDQALFIGVQGKRLKQGIAYAQIPIRSDYERILIRIAYKHTPPTHPY